MALSRFRLRTLMLAVAAVAVLIWGIEMWRRSRASRLRADLAVSEEENWERSKYGWLELLRQAEEVVRGGERKLRD